MRDKREGLRDCARRLARQNRIRAIVDGAKVRGALGQGAMHELAGGVHLVTHRGRRFTARTLDLAIAAAEAGGGAERERG